MSQAQLKALEAYLRIMNINGAAQVFRAAADLGVFDALSAGQLTAAGVATACEAKAGPVELLLDSLCAVGVLERYGDDFALAPVMRLLPGEERDLGDRYWQHLPQFLRDGEPLANPALAAHDSSHYRAKSIANQWMMTPAALSIVKALEIGTTRKGLRILDLGAGSGVWSLTVAYSDVDARVTAVDWPSALAAAEATAAGIGLGDRFETIAGDYRTVPLPNVEFDLAIIANLTHLESAADTETLFRRVFAALKPSGEVAVVDVFPGQTAGDMHRTLFALGLAMRTEAGRILPPDEMQSLLDKAGFDKPTFAHLPVPPYTLGLLVAKKKGS